MNRHEFRPRCFGSWSAAAPDFQAAFDYLERCPEVLAASTLINANGGSSGHDKEVRRCELPAEYGGWTICWKVCHGKKPWRYWFRPSLPVRELRNYQWLTRLGIPTARVLAVGDRRCGFQLRESFLVTEFLTGTRDGREFMPGGAAREAVAERRAFTLRSVALLARINRVGFFHKAFHARNLLWRSGEPGELAVFLIDVARCRRVAPEKMRRPRVVDLHTLLWDLRLPAEEVDAAIRGYLENDPSAPFDFAALRRELAGYRRRAGEAPRDLYRPA